MIYYASMDFPLPSLYKIWQGQLLWCISMHNNTETTALQYLNSLNKDG